MPKKRKYQAAATLHGMSLSSLLQDQEAESEKPALPKVELRDKDELLPTQDEPRGLLMKCPSCGRRMELDVGFAGSVCRCNHCKALVTVPGELPSGGEKTVQRNDRPDAPAAMTGKNQTSKSDASKASLLEKLSALEKEKDDDDELRIPLPESMQSSEPVKATRQADDPFSAFLTTPTPTTTPTVTTSAAPTASAPTMSMIKQAVKLSDGSVSKLSVGQLWLIMGVAVAAGLLFALVVVEVLLG